MPTIKTNFTKVSLPTSNWNTQERHTYGADVNTGVRIVYGDHVRYGGNVKVPYKFINRTDYSYV